jgi:hypothetical protein
LYVNALHALAGSCDGGAACASAAVAADAELPEELANPQECTQHRAGVGVAFGSHLPAGDLLVEGGRHGVDDLRAIDFGRESFGRIGKSRCEPAQESVSLGGNAMGRKRSGV